MAAMCIAKMLKKLGGVRTIYMTALRKRPRTLRKMLDHRGDLQSLNIHGKLSESAIDNNNDKDNAKQLENGDRGGEEDDHGG